MTEFVRILKKKELPKVVPFYYGGSQPGAQPPEALPQLPGKKPKKFLPALKYNHEHDELGRFATSGGGTGAMREMFGRVSQPDGGFTYQPTSHEEPKEGFAVSPYPERSFAVDEKDFTFKSLVDYVTKNRDMFEQPDHFVGAWHDPESHQIFLDVSVVSKDAAAAETLAKNHDQIAYFDLKAGKSVTVNREATSGGVVKGIRDGRRKDTEATNTAFDAWQESDGLKSFSDFVRKFNWAQTNRTRVKRGASLTGFAQVLDRQNFQKQFLEVLKYSPDQPRDERGRFATVGGFNSSGLIPDGMDSRAKYSQNGVYTPERLALHQRIIDSYLQGVPKSAHPTVFLVGGGPASGKSSTIRAGLIPVPAKGMSVQINADDIKEKIPEYGALTKAGNHAAAMLVHEESSDITHKLMAAAYAQQKDVTWDGTGDSSFEKLAGKVQQMHDAGYTVKANYVTLPTELAVSNANKRGITENRFVPDNVVREIHRDVSTIFPRLLKAGTFDEMHLFDNSEKGHPKLVLAAAGGVTKIHDQSAYDRFLAKANE